MEYSKETKHGTPEDLQKDMEQCGFHETGSQPVQEIPLESQMAKTRMQIDNAMQSILAESKLPLFLFDYLITSVQNDIRKADIDMERMSKTAEPYDFSGTIHDGSRTGSDTEE